MYDSPLCYVNYSEAVQSVIQNYYDFLLFLLNVSVLVGRDSSVGITIRYGLNGPGIESRWGGEIFLTRPDRSWGPPSLNKQWVTRLFPGG
jgi:hypothetical protein